MMLAALALTLQVGIPYCTVDGKTLTLNAFLPAAAKPTPAMVEIHGGWFIGGGPAEQAPEIFTRKGIAYFAIAYRLGDEGGFPKNIRDCRNAIRFLRKNAKRFNIDPNRIAVMGGSAGGHLSLMTAMVPENFVDGGPTPELKGISARVCGSFSWIAPTDFVRFWRQGPSDEIVQPDGTKRYRHWDDNVPNDARPHLRALFHGVGADTKAGEAMYRKMSPIGHIRRGLPPLLICDGQTDPIVPGTMGKDLHEKLRKVGVDSTYWLTKGGHEYPGGEGFDQLLEKFIERIYAGTAALQSGSGTLNR